MKKITIFLMLFLCIYYFPAIGLASASKIPVKGMIPYPLKPVRDYTGKSASNSSFFSPPLDSNMVVASGIEYLFPTAYPPQRSVIYHKLNDTYYIGINNMDSFYLFFWFESCHNFWAFIKFSPDSLTNVGKPSLLGSETDNSVSLTWHQADSSFYEIWFANYSSGEWWFTNVSDEQDTATETWASLTRDSGGNLWIADEYSGTDSQSHDMVVHKSTDAGLTWSGAVALNPFKLVDTWSMPVIAADPSNGDVWVAYHDTISSGEHLDLVVHKYDSQKGKWEQRQIIDKGGTGSQCVLPSIVVDSKHNLHVVYQKNMALTGNTGGLNGFSHLGPSGPLWYVYGSTGNWSEPAPLTGVSDTDSVTGLPSLGIDDRDNLYAAFVQIDSASSAGGGSFTMFNTFNTYIVRKQPGKQWEKRFDCSRLGNVSFADSFHCTYAHVTPMAYHDPTGLQHDGPGVCWTQLKNCTPPSSVNFNHPYTVDVKDGEQDAKHTKPEGIKLGNAYPNPMNPMTTIKYSIPEQAHVQLIIYDVSGRRVKMLVDSSMQEGEYCTVWDGSNEAGAQVTSGVYFYSLRAGNVAETKRLLVIK